RERRTVLESVLQFGRVRRVQIPTDDQIARRGAKDLEIPGRPLRFVDDRGGGGRQMLYDDAVGRLVGRQGLRTRIAKRGEQVESEQRSANSRRPPARGF